MDRKSLIILGVSFVLIMLWFKLVEVWYPPAPPSSTNMVAGATNYAGTNAVATNFAATNIIQPVPMAAQTASPVSAASASVLFRIPTAEEKLEVLDTPDVRYTFTSHGGGLKLVELKRYRESVASFGKAASDTNRLATLNTKAPVPALTLLGGDAVQDAQPFTLTRTANGLRAEKQLANGLALVKEFRPGSNYLLHATVRLENHSAQPLALPAEEWVIGTATPMSVRDDGQLMGTRWFNGSKADQVGASWYDNASFMGCLTGARNPRSTYTGGNSNVFWASAHNQFFTMIAVPTNGPAAEIVSRRVTLPPPAAELSKDDSKVVTQPFGFQTALLFNGVTLAPGGAMQREFLLFTGPKEYHTLARLAKQFGNELDLEMGFGFGSFFAKCLLLAMNGLNSIGLPYWLCIISITVIIKLLFWPLTTASTRSMKRMQELQPQIKALQDRYKEDPQKMNVKMMELWKENKVNPMSGCLPMLVQIPVFIGFFSMIRTAIELRGERFLWAADLSQPDTIAHVAGLPVNPLPVVMAVTMLWQARLSPPSPGMDPMQQKMMKYMPLMFVVMLYNYSAGLTLYWTVQNLLTIAQTKYTYAKQEKEKAAAAAPKSDPTPKKKK
ncbi:MAG: membrane protein insertase YidC [Verrucomicrobia bacterium]|nr:membrane protein insertase YidC [Verrucomicrobiota bacterium]